MQITYVKEGRLYTQHLQTTRTPTHLIDTLNTEGLAEGARVSRVRKREITQVATAITTNYLQISFSHQSTTEDDDDLPGFLRGRPLTCTTRHPSTTTTTTTTVHHQNKALTSSRLP